MRLDIPSIIVMSAFMNGLMALILFMMRKSYPRHIRGLAHWGFASASWSVAGVFLASRNSGLPAALLIFLPNVLMLLGSIFFFTGYQRFIGRSVRLGAWSLFLAIVALLLVWQGFTPAGYAGRLIVMSTAFGGVYLLTLVYMLRFGQKRLPVYFTVVALAIHTLVMAVRLAVAPLSQGMYEQTLVQTVYIGSFIVFMQLYPIGAILMATDRLALESERQAHYDALTGIYNRRALLQYCEEEFERAVRTGRNMALMFIDLDHFKRINDSYGHQHGDKVLQYFAKQVASTLRPTDRFGRYGGEEFAVVLPETSMEAAQTVAHRIHEVLATGHALDCKVSIGLTMWLGSEDTVEVMFARADRALYTAKEQGRNRTCTA